MEPRVTDLPFKRGEAIVILRALPVLQCKQCADIELENTVMQKVEQILDRSGACELEVIRFAA